MDCADKDRIYDAKEEFRKIINDREMRDCNCILIYANKQDSKGAVKATEIPELLGLDTLSDHRWTVQPSCGRTGDGLEHGLDWLMENALEAQRQDTNLARHF